MRPAFLLMIFLSLLQGALAYAALDSAAEAAGAPHPMAISAMAVAPATSATTGDDAVYTVAQSKLNGGTVLRAYSDTGGKVFALSWSGPALPDLRALLGEHFGDGAAGKALAGQPRRDDMVIVSGARRRVYTGRAWLPAALPPGFDSHSIE